MKKLYCVLAAAAMALTANADLYLCGNAGGKTNHWSPEDPVVVTEDNGSYTFEVTGGFKMSTKKGTKEGDWATFNSGCLAPAESFPMKQEFSVSLNTGDADINPPYTATWTVTVSSDFKTATFKTDTAAPTGEDAYAKIYLRGTMNAYGADDAYKFSTTDGDKYTLTGITLTAKEKFKVADANWGAVNYGYDKPIELNTPTVINKGGGDMNLKEGGEDLTLIFVLSTATFTVSDGGEIITPPVREPDPMEDWYVNVVGPFNGWVCEGTHPDSDGWALVTNLALDADGFKVKVWDGIEDHWYNNGQAIALDTKVKVEGNEQKMMTVAGWTEGTIYNVKFNVISGEMEISIDTESGVSAIESAEGVATYFNLQGMKVENPENGIFVKIANGKAVKVAL